MAGPVMGVRSTCAGREQTGSKWPGGFQRNVEADEPLVPDEGARNSMRLVMGGCNQCDRADLLEYA